MRLTEIMDLYKLHSNPTSLNNHSTMTSTITCRVGGLIKTNHFVHNYIFDTSNVPPFEIEFEDESVITILKRDANQHTAERSIDITGSKIDCDSFIQAVQEENLEGGQLRPVTVKVIGNGVKNETN